MSKETRIVEIGSHERVVIEKVFGPHIFTNLRITPDCERGWVIERKRIDTGEWEEQCVIDDQRVSEFEEDEQQEVKDDGKRD